MKINPDHLPWRRRRAAQKATAEPKALPRWWPVWLPAWPLRFGRAGIAIGLACMFAGWLVMETVSGVVFQPPLGDRLCRWQPLTGGCSALGIGNLPTPEQLRDFAAAQGVGTRQALNAFRDKHKDSPLDAEALRALARCREVMVPVPVTERHDLMATQPLTSASQARAGAEAQAALAAERLCRRYESGEAFRFIRAQAERSSLDCVSSGGQQMCTWIGEAVCDLEEFRPVERCESAAVE